MNQSANLQYEPVKSSITVEIVADTTLNQILNSAAIRDCIERMVRKLSLDQSGFTCEEQHFELTVQA